MAKEAYYCTVKELNELGRDADSGTASVEYTSDLQLTGNACI